MTRAILVKSCQRYRPRREACEATWAGELYRHVPVYFVEAGHPATDLNGNVIELHSRDDYDSNSLKVREAVRYLLKSIPFDSLFICDDNTFVHPARWLAHEPYKFEGLMSERIPWVHGGAGWWMNRQLCELYVAGVRKRCSWDDKMATEILTMQHGWHMANRPDLYAQWDERVSAENALITCHNVDCAEMLTLFKATRDLPATDNLLQRT